MDNHLPLALVGFRGFLQSIICIVLSVRWQINLVNIVDWCLYRLLVLWLWRGWGRWCQWKLSYTMVSSGAATDHDDHDHCSGTMIVSRAAVILIEILSELGQEWSLGDAGQLIMCQILSSAQLMDQINKIETSKFYHHIQNNGERGNQQ